MANRKLTFTAWLGLVKRHALDDGFPNVAGYPVAEVAAKLDVSRSRVHQLLEAGVLDSIEICANGKTAMYLVTEASLDRYLSHRVRDRGRQGYFAFQE